MTVLHKLLLINILYAPVALAMYHRLNQNGFPSLILFHEKHPSGCKQHYPTTLLLRPLCFSPLLWTEDLRAQLMAIETVDRQRKKLSATKNININILWVRGLSPFVPHCSFSHSYSPVTQLNAILPLCFSLATRIPPPLSLSLSPSLASQYPSLRADR